MAVGDVNSSERGSGARYNDGKLQMDLIPVSYWLDHWYECGELDGHMRLRVALEALSAFQLGDDDSVHQYMSGVDTMALEDATRVLEYGALKYAAWNWAKGMAWSVPTGCILRHARAIIEGQDIDHESGQPHMGHVVCNMMMLSWFIDHYPEGDDRPPVRETTSNEGLSPWLTS